MKFERCPENPILKPIPDSVWESSQVINPAVIYENGTFWMYYRASADDDKYSIYLGLAKSTDGVHFERCSDKPFMAPSPEGPDGNGIEDPRVIKMDDAYYMTYASRPLPTGRCWLPEGHEQRKVYTFKLENGPALLNMNNTATYLAVSRNLTDWVRLGRMTDSRGDDRDVVIFPEKVNGQYVMLSRNQYRVGPEYGCSIPSIWISFSNDLLEWHEHKLLCTGREDWEGKKIGASTPPILTDKGWLLIYHGVENKRKGAYGVGAMLLDTEHPDKIIARTKEPIMVPEYDYEKEGNYAGCVFPTGIVELDGTLYIYYGSGDKYCNLATCDKQELVDYLYNECRG